MFSYLKKQIGYFSSEVPPDTSPKIRTRADLTYQVIQDTIADCQGFLLSVSDEQIMPLVMSVCTGHPSSLTSSDFVQLSNGSLVALSFGEKGTAYPYSQEAFFKIRRKGEDNNGEIWLPGDATSRLHMMLIARVQKVLKGKKESIESLILNATEGAANSAAWSVSRGVPAENAGILEETLSAKTPEVHLSVTRATRVIEGRRETYYEGTLQAQILESYAVGPQMDWKTATNLDSRYLSSESARKLYTHFEKILEEEKARSKMQAWQRDLTRITELLGAEKISELSEDLGEESVGFLAFSCSLGRITLNKRRKVDGSFEFSGKATRSNLDQELMSTQLSSETVEKLFTILAPQKENEIQSTERFSSSLSRFRLVSV